MRGSFFHSLFMCSAGKPGTAAGTVISVAVRRQINCPVFRWMAVFTGMVNTSVICPEMLQIRSIRLPHTGIEIDAVRVCVINSAGIGHQDFLSGSIGVFSSAARAAEPAGPSAHHRFLHKESPGDPHQGELRLYLVGKDKADQVILLQK